MHSRTNQNGFALVLSLMIVLVLSVMAAGLMYNVINEKTITSNRMRSSQALVLAKAGTAEAIARLSVPYSLTNDTSIVQNISGGVFTPNWNCYITLNTPSSPGSGDSIIYKKSVQPTATALRYSENYGNFGDTSTVLHVRYKRFDANGNGVLTPDEIYFYDYKRDMITLGRNSPTPADAYPVWEIIATGRTGTSRRTLVTEVVIPRFTAKTRAGLSSVAPVVGTGNADVCGHDHPTSTPYNLSPPNCFDAWHVYAGGNPHGDAANNWATLVARSSCTQAGCVTGIESNSTITDIGANKKSWGNPDYKENSTRPVYKIWEIMGMDSATCTNLPWGNDMYPVQGLVRRDGNTMYAGHGAGMQHEGILWIRNGDLHSSSNLAIKGLVYIEGDYRSTGTTWVLGGIVVRGNTETRITGSIDVLYSSQMIARVVQNATGTSMKIISQREVDQKY